MLSSIKNLYHAEDLPGEFLVQPLKRYHSFFAKRIEESSGIKKAALVIANIFSGVIAYPLLGLAAGVGMLIKLTGVREVRKYNELAHSAVRVCHDGIMYSKGAYNRHGGHWTAAEGKQLKLVREFKLTKQNWPVFAEIEAEVNALTRQFRKVYVDTSGQVNNEKNEGEISLKLFIHEKA